ncbi:MAG: mechanosensitive ion channel, partial [Gammaproteobacteria bacterium]
ESASELDEETRTRLIDSYRKSLAFLEEAASSEAAAKDYRQARESAPAQAAAIREKLEQAEKTGPEVTLTVTDATPLDQLEQELLKEKANHAAVDAKLNELEQQLTNEADRPAEVRKRLVEANTRQEELGSKLKFSSPEGELPELRKAKRWAMQSESRALNARIHKYDQELLSQPMRIQLLEAQRDQQARSLSRILARVQQLEALVSGKRLAEAEQAATEAEQARRMAEGSHPLVQTLARQNIALSEELTSLAEKLKRVSALDDAANKEAKRLGDALRNTRQKLEIAGLNQALGLVLLKQRRELPNLRDFRKEFRENEQKVADASLRLIQYDEERRALRDIPGYLHSLTADLPQDTANQLNEELTALAGNRRRLLEKAITITQAYLRTLSELDYAQRKLLDTVEAYDKFLAEHLLWIRSSPRPTLTMLGDIPRQMTGILAPANWLAVSRIFMHELASAPEYLLGYALFALLLWKSRSMRSQLAASGKKIGKPSSDRFGFTFQALLLTLLLASGWPLLLATVGWQLEYSLEATEFSRAVAKGLLWIAPALFYLRAFQVLCNPGGLAETHFRWPVKSVLRLQRNLNRLMITFLPLAFFAILLVNYDADMFGGGLNRLLFVSVEATLAIFFYHLFEPKRGVLQPLLSRESKTLLARLRYLWLGLTVTIPLGLAILAFLGFIYTSGILTQLLINTLWFILVLVVIHQLVVRWLLVTRRRLAFQAIIARREAAARAAAETSGSESAPGMPAREQVEEPAINLVALSEESRKLLNTSLGIVGFLGVWMIWSDVLPAFRILDDITLWQHTVTEAGEKKELPITLADAGLALLVVIATVVATKRFPAFLEIVLLQFIKLTAGGRYTVTTLMRYAIAAIGIILAVSMIGGSWNQIQWLVAALGVGIGFGLQEIVANFISGLIILFERPIRVGDIVTVGDTDGIVTRIQIRATTIRNWDRKELLVPNKEFITGRLLNWSLSDQTTRITIPVGVAYGSDVQQAMALMAEAAEEHERVIEDPAPFVIFEGFGDNALALVLRCYLDSLDYRLATISELHEAINDKFNAAGIVISFPQRDVHLDTGRPLDIRIHRGERKSDPNGETP